MRRPLLLTLIISIATLSSVAFATKVNPEVLKAQADRIALVEKMRPTVLAVFGGLPGRSGGGSGVVITPDGYALTNFHVVKPCGVYMKCGMADGKLYDAVLVGLDPTGDIALIKLLGRDNFPVAKLGDSDKLTPGDHTYAMGNPFLLASNLKPTVTHGIVSGVRRYQYPSGTILEYTDCIQTDAAVNPGNSGGPLFNDKGELVGINGRCSFEKRGRVSVGVGYAVSINQIKKFLGPLRSGRIVDHAWLGATVVFDDGGRVVVDDIALDTDIYRRGLSYQDQILQVAGRTIDSPNTMKNLMGIFPAGWRVPVTFRRDDQEHTIYVKLPPLHRGSELIDAVAGKTKPKPQPHGEPEKKPGEHGKKPNAPKPGKKPPKMKKIPLHPKSHPDMKKLHPRIQKLLAEAKKQKLPEQIQKVYKKRTGYANAYFNTVESRRVYDAWSKATQREKLVGNWTLKGQTEAKLDIQLVLNQAGITVEFGGSSVLWGAKEDWGPKLGQDQTGGLFLALHCWHRLATNGTKGFDLFNYQGTYPAPRFQKEGTVLRDVLIGKVGGFACWFYFDQKTGYLTEIEFYIQEIGMDPCLVELRDYKAVEGKTVPTSLKVYRGENKFSPIQINTFKVGK